MLRFNVDFHIADRQNQGCQMAYFQNKKIQFWYIFEGLETENVGTFFAHKEYITAVWYILWPFGN
jgi:hypothetical protein